MTIKKIVATLILSTICWVTLAQSAKYPYVESQYHSEYGSTNVIGVFVDGDSTYILLEDITPRGYSGLWISFSDKTILTYSNTTLKIKGWGYWTGEDVQEKEFNKQYSLQSDRRYHFVLVFPRISAGIKKISIKENIPGGFYWNGIHLDEQSSDSSKQSRGREKNDFGINGIGSSSPHQDSTGNDSFEPTGSGSCFAISSRGYLVTCYHVIEDARKIKIRGINGDFSTLYTAKVIASDKRNDLAILKISDNSFSSISEIPYTIASGSSDVGENVFVLGYPLRAIMGDEIKLTNGLISSKTGYQGDVTAYQISATVQPGNSGGPLFDGDGNIIGVVNARLAVESASYAVKSPYLRMLAETIEEPLHIPTVNQLRGKTLKEQVKEINKFIYIIEVE